MSKASKIAKQVIQTEYQALKRMMLLVDKSFDHAVQLISNSKQPIIVIGMGKPYFIAQKISASLASTGTTSFSMHPADALHGDFGRITKRSVVILLSNSGETSEILALMPILNSLKTSQISITGNTKSTLAKKSDCVLDTSVLTEAQPLNVAPTASTTCMLAMGDALTMALVEKKNFKIKDFALLHPGGMLGRKLRMTVRDVMRKGNRNPCVKENTSLKATLLKITSSKAGSATILDKNGKCIGIFTDGDLRRQFTKLLKMADQPIKNFMTKRPQTIKADTLIDQALNKIKTSHIDELPVVDHRGQVVGLLDVQDVLNLGFVLPT